MIPAASKERNSTNSLDALRERWLPAATGNSWHLLTLSALTVLVLLIIWIAYLIPGTGLGEQQLANGQVLPAKTLWDWIGLLTLPLVIAAVAYWHDRSRRVIDLETAHESQTITVQVAQDEQQQRALEAYLDQVTRLLVEQHLLNSQADDEVRSIARARTFAVIRLLGHERNAMVVKFLREAGLIISRDIVSFKEADLSRVDLEGADLRGMDLNGANLSGANLTGADLLQANLSGANLGAANLARANLNYADLRRADLRQANLAGAQLFRSNLLTARLEMANLSNANLSLALLKLARLTGADLSSANLGEADLSNAVLFNARLIDASLSEADFTNATLTNADLTRAVLTGAKLSDRQLARTRSLAGATFPDGSVRQEAGAHVNA